MSVMTQLYGSVPSPAKNSSADANPRAPYPNEDSASTTATRNDSSSSMTAIKGSLDTTYQPFSVDLRGVIEFRLGVLFHKRHQGNYTAVSLLPFPTLWLPGFDHLGHPDEVS